MKRLLLENVLEAIGGKIIKGKKNQIIEHVTTKSMSIKSNTLFFNYKRRKIDLRALVSKKQSMVLVTENKPYFLRKKIKNIKVIKVKNIEQAYWNFIKYYRKLFDIPVIGVTGTCGKTTTTDMLKKILSTKYNTQSTRDGLNGLGYNLGYLLNFDDSTQAGVFELGLMTPGWIKQSCLYFQPSVGIILNIGVYHLQGCKTMENYINAKAEILEGMQNKGILIINEDDQNIKKINFNQFKGEIIKIGINQRGTYQANSISFTEEGIDFNLNYKDKKYPVFVPGHGQHNVYNAMAAIAASHAVGIKIEDAIKALADFTHMYGHLQFRNGINGSTIIDDTWNCTPSATKAALQILKHKANGRKKIAVIGYMPSLGENGMDEYLKVGEEVVKSGVDLLLTLGYETEAIGKRALELGMDKKRIILLSSKDKLHQILQGNLDKNSLALFKFPYQQSLKKHPSFQLMEECQKFYYF